MVRVLHPCPQIDTYTLRCPLTATQASGPTVFFSAKSKLDIGWPLPSIWEAQLWGWVCSRGKKNRRDEFHELRMTLLSRAVMARL